MGAKGRKGRKVRVDFRSNRQPRRRESDLTRRLHEDEQAVLDASFGESVRAKGELSRKRTLILDERDAPVVDQSQWKPGVVTVVHGLVCRVDQAGRSWDCVVRRKLRTMLIAQRTAVACGDRVWFSDQSQHHDGQAVGVIERVEPRRTTLSRSDFRGREHVMVANADQLLIVSSVARPRPKPHLIDRYLVAAGKGSLRPVIVFNKSDLAPVDTAQSDASLVEIADGAHSAVDEDGTAASPRMNLTDLFAEYRSLGYTVLRTSAVTGENLEALRSELGAHVTVLAGQSGVGKSSLINALQPGLNLEVREVSDETEKGRHTTTLARLLPLDFGGYVVDTPGIRQFDLWNIEPGELEAYFVEIASRVARCKFKDCHHVQEEGCAVRIAVESGEMSERRYASYRKMLEETARARQVRGA
ncbi:MAG: ribosome small subunit-dependent GTPase A [Phycisphaerae bacterium]|jgi:ribosome biogenesis GTPase